MYAPSNVHLTEPTLPKFAFHIVLRRASNRDLQMGGALSSYRVASWVGQQQAEVRQRRERLTLSGTGAQLASPSFCRSPLAAFFSSGSDWASSAFMSSSAAADAGAGLSSTRGLASFSGLACLFVVRRVVRGRSPPAKRALASIAALRRGRCWGIAAAQIPQSTKLVHAGHRVISSRGHGAGNIRRSAQLQIAAIHNTRPRDTYLLASSSRSTEHPRTYVRACGIAVLACTAAIRAAWA
jgi:hypothetical protein